MRDHAFSHTSVSLRDIRASLEFIIYPAITEHGALLRRAMFQNWTYTAFKINGSIRSSRSRVSRYSSGSFLARRIPVYSTLQYVFSLPFLPPLLLSLSLASDSRMYERVTDLCKLEQKRLLSGYLSALTRSPRRRPSRDEILPTLSVASLFVERR